MIKIRLRKVKSIENEEIIMTKIINNNSNNKNSHNNNNDNENQNW